MGFHQGLAPALIGPVAVIIRYDGMAIFPSPYPGQPANLLFMTVFDQVFPVDGFLLTVVAKCIARAKFPHNHADVLFYGLIDHLFNGIFGPQTPIMGIPKMPGKYQVVVNAVLDGLIQVFRR